MDKTHRRLTRKMSPEQKEKISRSLKRWNSIHKRDAEWCRKISEGNKKAWSRIPRAEEDQENG